MPEGYAWQEITAFLMKEHGLEIAGGLGPSVGKVGSALPSHLPLVPQPASIQRGIAACHQVATHTVSGVTRLYRD